MSSQQDPCRQEGCDRPRVRHGVYCDEHHREQLDRATRAMPPANARTPHELEFCYEAMPVGYFVGPMFPSRPGRYRYEPYRGPGHYEMQTALRSGQRPTCTFVSGGRRHSCVVASCPEYGLLQLVEFTAAMPEP